MRKITLLFFIFSVFCIVHAPSQQLKRFSFNYDREFLVEGISVFSYDAENKKFTELGKLYDLATHAPIQVGQQDRDAAVVNFFLEKIDTSTPFADAFTIGVGPRIDAVCYKKSDSNRFVIFADKKVVRKELEHRENIFQGDLDYFFFIYFQYLFDKKIIKNKGYKSANIDSLYQVKGQRNHGSVDGPVCLFNHRCENEDWLLDKKQQGLVPGQLKEHLLWLTFEDNNGNWYEFKSEIEVRSSYSHLLKFIEPGVVRIEDFRSFVTKFDMSQRIRLSAWLRIKGEDISTYLKSLTSDDVKKICEFFFNEMSKEVNSYFYYSSLPKTFTIKGLNSIIGNPDQVNRFLKVCIPRANEGDTGLLIDRAGDCQFLQLHDSLFLVHPTKEQLEIIGKFPPYKPEFDPFLDHICEEFLNQQGNLNITNLQALERVNGFNPIKIGFSDRRSDALFFKDDYGKYRFFYLQNLDDYQNRLTELVRLLSPLPDYQESIKVKELGGLVFLGFNNKNYVMDEMGGLKDRVIDGAFELFETDRGVFVYQKGGQFCYVQKDDKQVVSNHDVVPVVTDPFISLFFEDYEIVQNQMPLLKRIQRARLVELAGLKMLGVTYSNGVEKLIASSEGDTRSVFVHDIEWFENDDLTGLADFLNSLLNADQKLNETVWDCYFENGKYFAIANDSVYCARNQELVLVENLVIPSAFSGKERILLTLSEKSGVLHSEMLFEGTTFLIIKFLGDSAYYCFPDGTDRNNVVPKVENILSFKSRDLEAQSILIFLLENSIGETYVMYEVEGRLFAHSDHQILMYQEESKSVYPLILECASILDKSGARILALDVLKRHQKDVRAGIYEKVYGGTHLSGFADMDEFLLERHITYYLGAVELFKILHHDSIPIIEWQDDTLWLRESLPGLTFNGVDFFMQFAKKDSLMEIIESSGNDIDSIPVTGFFIKEKSSYQVRLLNNFYNDFIPVTSAVFDRSDLMEIMLRESSRLKGNVSFRLKGETLFIFNPTQAIAYRDTSTGSHPVMSFGNTEVDYRQTSFQETLIEFFQEERVMEIYVFNDNTLLSWYQNDQSDTVICIRDPIYTGNIHVEITFDKLLSGIFGHFGEDCLDEIDFELLMRISRAYLEDGEVNFNEFMAGKEYVDCPKSFEEPILSKIVEFAGEP